MNDSNVTENNGICNNGNHYFFYGNNNQVSMDDNAARSIREDFKEFNVPFKPPFGKNPNFCGRKHILDELHDVLQPQNVDGSNFGRKTVILHRIEGVGKLQNSLEYILNDRFSSYSAYTSIFWIDAGNDSRIAESAFHIMDQLVTHYETKWRASPDYSEIAIILGIPGQIDEKGNIKLSTPGNAMSAVHGWLGREENRRWLLIIDNKNTAESTNIDKILPTCNWGSVIVTLRQSNIHQHGKCIEIQEMEPKYGLELMLKSSGINEQSLEETEVAAINEIITALGELPLALDQAAAYIRSQKIDFSAYRNKLKNGINIFKNEFRDSSLSIYQDSIFTAWELSFKVLTEDARQLLCLCAFLGNDDIPEELFIRGKKAVDWIMEDEDRLYNAMESLFTLSFAKRKKPDSFWIHPLVHTWTRGRIDGTAMRPNIKSTPFLVGAAIDMDADKTSLDARKFQRRILNHMNVCQRNISKDINGLDNILEVAQALTALGLAYESLEFYKQAEELFRHLFEANERTYGSDHPTTMQAMGNLVNVIKYQGRPAEALEMYLNMASVLNHLGRHEEELEIYKKALAGSEEMIGSDHPNTLTILHNMASVFEHLGRHDEALEMYEMALAGRDKSLGSDHPDTLTTVHMMISFFKHKQWYEEATLLEERYKLRLTKCTGEGCYFIEKRPVEATDGDAKDGDAKDDEAKDDEATDHEATNYEATQLQVQYKPRLLSKFLYSTGGGGLFIQGRLGEEPDDEIMQFEERYKFRMVLKPPITLPEETIH
ncbi:hypothetical protein RUND412_001529 [Rhizina undulata]